ncbi:MAG TPA: hypothetical protein VKZ53_03115 [Candidatus Angelobacter sp.]|nr:hypothetical protein [Candidatus Angelobacter sp.]
MEKALRSLTFVAVFSFLANLGAAGSVAVGENTPHDNVGMFAGRWESKSASKDTAYSKAASIEAKVACAWSPLGKYLVCDQLISIPANQLTVFSYNEKEKSYKYCTFNNPGESAHCGVYTIEGNTWTFSNSFEEKGKKVVFRTLNIFDSPGHMTFRSEFSDDGKTWTTTLEGESRRVKER